MLQLNFYFIFSIFKSSFTVAGKVAAESTGPSQLKLDPTDGVTCSDSVVGRGESEHNARTANQLIPTSPVAKKCNVDRPIRIKSTKSITDWANSTGATGFSSILNTEA